MSTKKLTILILTILITIGVGLYVLTVNNKSDNNNTSDDNSNKTINLSDETTQINKPKTFTFEDVSSHNKANDCWTIIDGGVYDITSYVPKHPGGNEILLACGVDGTSLFEQRITNSGETVGSGQPHGSGAKSQLSRLQIGTLSN